MENKQNFMGIIIPVVIAVILLTVLPIINSMNVECPPCEEIPSYNIGQINVNPNFSSGDYIVDKESYDYLDSVTVIKDDNLIPENIKKDVDIFGVVGTLESAEIPYLTIKILNQFGSNHQCRVPSIKISGEELFNSGFALDLLNGTFQIVFSDKSALDNANITSIYVGEQRTGSTSQDTYGYTNVNGSRQNFTYVQVGRTIELSSLLPSGNIIEISTSYKAEA